jgi:hypothetical protein
MGPVQLLTGLIRGHNTTPREADMPDEGTVYALARRPDMDALRLAVSQPDVDLTGCDKYGLLAIHHAARAGNAQAVQVRKTPTASPKQPVLTTNLQAMDPTIKPI